MPSYIPEHVYGHPWPLHLARSQDIELTKKGEAYAAAADATDNLSTASLAEAEGIFFLTLNPNDRTSIATTVERLINMLDAMEPDPDLEDTGDGEPYLGWPTGHGPAQLRRDVPQDDREQDDSDAEDGADDEPTMGWEKGSNPYDQTHLASDAFFDECEDVSEDEGAQDDREPNGEEQDYSSGDDYPLSLAGEDRDRGSGKRIARELLKGVRPKRTPVRLSPSRYVGDSVTVRCLRMQDFDRLPWA